MVERTQHYTFYMIEDYPCSLQINKRNNIQCVDITWYFYSFSNFH